VTVFCEEFSGIAPSNRPERFQGVPQLQSTNVITSAAAGGAVSTVALAANTSFVCLSGDASGRYIYSGSSTGSTAAGSTGFFPANAQTFRGVKPLAKLFIWST